MQTYFQNNNGEELIVLLNGWGMDERPYALLKSNRDILFVSDYNDLTGADAIKLLIQQKKYEKTILIAFSAGVFMAKYLSDILPEFDYKIAVNGTFDPFNPDKGIDKSSLFEMENISLDTALGFRQKLFDKEKHFRLFNKNQPLRDLKSSQNELKALKKYYSENKNNNFIFDKVIVSANDKIIPLKNYLLSWHNHPNIHQIEDGHFPFYNFLSFDDIID